MPTTTEKQDSMLLSVDGTKSSLQLAAEVLPQALLEVTSSFDVSAKWAATTKASIVPIAFYKRYTADTTLPHCEYFFVIDQANTVKLDAHMNISPNYSAVRAIMQQSVGSAFEITSSNRLDDGHTFQLTLTNLEHKKLSIAFTSRELFLQWNDALREALSEVIFQNIFALKTRTDSFVFQRAIETAILRYQTITHADNIFHQRVKSIWNIKLELQEILDLLTMDPKSITQEEVVDLLCRLDAEPLLSEDSQGKMLKRIQSRLFTKTAITATTATTTTAMPSSISRTQSIDSDYRANSMKRSPLQPLPVLQATGNTTTPKRSPTRSSHVLEDESNRENLSEHFTANSVLLPASARLLMMTSNTVNTSTQSPSMYSKLSKDGFAKRSNSTPRHSNNNNNGANESNSDMNQSVTLVSVGRTPGRVSPRSMVAELHRAALLQQTGELISSSPLTAPSSNNSSRRSTPSPCYNYNNSGSSFRRYSPGMDVSLGIGTHRLSPRQLEISTPLSQRRNAETVDASNISSVPPTPAMVNLALESVAPSPINKETSTNTNSADNSTSSVCSTPSSASLSSLSARFLGHRDSRNSSSNIKEGSSSDEMRQPEFDCDSPASCDLSQDLQMEPNDDDADDSVVRVQAKDNTAASTRVTTVGSAASYLPPQTRSSLSIVALMMMIVLGLAAGFVLGLLFASSSAKTTTVNPSEVAEGRTLTIDIETTCSCWQRGNRFFWSPSFAASNSILMTASDVAASLLSEDEQ